MTGRGTGSRFIRTTSGHEPEGYVGETVVILRVQPQLTPVAAPFEVRAFSGHPRIGPRESTGEDRCRTDAEGHFAVVLNMRPDTSVTLHAASRNFSHRAVNLSRPTTRIDPST